MTYGTQRTIQRIAIFLAQSLLGVMIASTLSHIVLFDKGWEKYASILGLCLILGLFGYLAERRAMLSRMRQVQYSWAFVCFLLGVGWSVGMFFASR